MHPRWLLLFPGLLLACSPAAPAPPVAPAPSASAPVAAAPTASSSPGWTAVDPRAIRCGVDDRPRNVLGELLPPDPVSALSPRALADRAMPEPPPNGGARLPEFAVAEPVGPTVPPPPRLFIERQSPTSPSGGALPADLAMAFSSINPQYEICASLVPVDSPVGHVDIDLELASSGAPLRVLPVGEGQPSAFARCLMERTCQYQTRTPLAQLTRVRVPLQVTREAPPPPRPPAPAQPESPVDVASEVPSQGLAELQLQLRAATSDVVRRCGAVAGRARVRFSLDLQTTPSTFRRRILSPRAVVTQIRTQTLEGTVSPATLSCVVGALSGRMFPVRLPPGQRTEKLLLTWNP